MWLPRVVTCQWSAAIWALGSAIVTLVSAVVVWTVWRGGVAALLATTFALDYDATIPAFTIVALADVGLRSGFRDWEITRLAILWFAPLFWRPLNYIFPLPRAVVSLSLALWLGVRRAGVFRRGRC